MADRISITICGDGGCGKSSLTLRLVRSQWTHEYDPTIEDSYSVTRVIDGLPYFLSLTDTAGQEEYRGLWATSNLKSDAFLFVYDITNASSIDTLDHFMDMVDIESDNRKEDNSRFMRSGVDGSLLQAPPVKIVAGNKCDLKDARVITSRQGLEWARKRGCGFMETSAREMVNVEETFALIVRRVVEARKVQARANDAYNSQEATNNPTSPLGQYGHSRESSAQQPQHQHQQSFATTAPLSPVLHEPEDYNAEKMAGLQRRGGWFRRLFSCF